MWISGEETKCNQRHSPGISFTKAQTENTQLLKGWLNEGLHLVEMTLRKNNDICPQTLKHGLWNKAWSKWK